MSRLAAVWGHLAGSATIPQELIDLIISDTDLDEDSLKSCALVAHSFLPSSQKRLFAKLVLEPHRCGPKIKARLQRLIQVLTASPHIMRHIRELHVIADSEIEGITVGASLPSPQSCLVSTIVTMLTNVETLLLGLNWEAEVPRDLDEAMRTCLALPSLRTLCFSYIHFGNATTLISLLRCCSPTLDTVTFLCVTVANEPESPTVSCTDATDTRLQLSSLNLVPLNQFQLECLEQTVDLRQLRRLCVKNSWGGLPPQPLLDATANITHLELTLNGDVIGHLPSVSIHHLRRLRALHITIRLLYPREDCTLAAKLLSTAPDTIENLELEFRVAFEVDFCAILRCANLEFVIVTSEMRSLRRVLVAPIYPCPVFTGVSHTVQETFPELNRRGILEFRETVHK
ncbi:hypothetical protein C8F04DRAFT_1277494 [Mycena alexandri]|uniref:Uncharacterized protein n=1 Tax=Mycena alexandri TaxID=1745969 RepID=A0AAD6WP61_9AGAR|nr:hypothetical protein C8F04DRAFT_1277494 [Mycena alexandri]